MVTKMRIFAIAASMLAITVISACGGDGEGLFNLGTASNDGEVSSAEAVRLLGSNSETGEPENVSGLTLANSDTAEPFDLPD